MGAKKKEYPVTLHVYDYAPGGVQNLMGLLGGGAGVFISGVEIDGTEYGYGDDGVRSHPPGALPPAYASARPREKIQLGVATLSPRELSRILARLKGAFPREAHDLLRLNTNHFSHAIAEALGVDAPPPWLNKLAGSASAGLSLAGSLAGAFMGSMQAAANSQQCADARAVPVNARCEIPYAEAVPA